jgi:hypothetical protein
MAQHPRDGPPVTEETILELTRFFAHRVMAIMPKAAAHLV